MKFYAVDDAKITIDANIETADDRIKIIIPKESVNKDSRSLYVSGDIFKAKTGDNGYYLCGCDFDDYSSFLTYFKERDDFEFSNKRSLMNVFGIKSAGYAYTGTVSGMEYDYRFHISKCGDEYSFGLFYDLQEVDIYEDIIIELLYMDKDATYIDMAKRYRRYMTEERNCVLLSEKIKSRDILEYIRDSVEIRIRMAWKPAPPEITEQTVENEPEIHVACTFDDVKEFVKGLKQHGVEKAQICLVGWNKSGHDGRWPTAFPVEPLLGGEEKLRELIAFTQENGYKIICHTNSTDCYSISDLFNGGEITVKTKAGEWEKDDWAWSGGTMYHLCPVRAWEYAKELLPKVAELGFSGTHYIDVISVNPVKNCFDKNHPCTSREFAQYMEKIAALSTELFGGFSSEGSFDHAAHYLDYGLYTLAKRKREVCMDEGVCFWEIAFHGLLMANSTSTTINYPLKRPEDRLIAMMFNARPAFYVYQKFFGVEADPTDETDFKINTQADIERTAGAVSASYAEYLKLSFLQSEFIEEFKEIADKVFEVIYSDKTAIIANFGDEDYKSDSMVIKAKDYVVIAKGRQ